jgi:hypothetical protein
MSETLTKSSEDVKNADIKFRKNSHMGWEFRHRDLIDNGKFWNSYLPKALNSNNNSWSETMSIIQNMLKQNSSIIINVY